MRLPRLRLFSVSVLLLCPQVVKSEVSLSDGGVVFPDGTMQTTAATSGKPTQSDCPCTWITNAIHCFANVPQGKVLRVDSITGYSSRGEPKFIELQSSPGETIYKVPRFVASGGRHYFELDGPAVVTDNDNQQDPWGGSWDLRVKINVSTTGNFGSGDCMLVGTLFDD